MYLLWLEGYFVPAVLHEEHVSYGSSRLRVLLNVRYLPSTSCIVPTVPCGFYVPYYSFPGKVRVHMVLPLITAFLTLEYPTPQGALRGRVKALRSGPVLNVVCRSYTIEGN